LSRVISRERDASPDEELYKKIISPALFFL